MDRSTTGERGRWRFAPSSTACGTTAILRFDDTSTVVILPSSAALGSSRRSPSPPSVKGSLHAPGLVGADREAGGAPALPVAEEAAGSGGPRADRVPRRIARRQWDGAAPPSATVVLLGVAVRCRPGARPRPPSAADGTSASESTSRPLPDP